MNAEQRLFLRLFLPISLIVIAGTWLYGSQNITHELAQITNRETLNVKLGAGALSDKIDSLTSDLDFLSRHSALLSAINQPTAENIKHLAEDFAIFSQNKRVYDQIRWIDETGMEQVRIDYADNKPQMIATDRLQNKGQRYYFTDTFRLQPGEVFISPFDLNVEHNQIEIPYKPMIRLATSVTDQQGKKRGIVILNYNGSELLRSFTLKTENTAADSMIVNREGYWLKYSDPANEWGFMLKRPDLNIKHSSPAAWQEISTADSGQISFRSGLWTWDTVYPLLINQKTSTGTPEVKGSSMQALEARQYYWKVISQFSANKLDNIQQSIWNQLIIISSFLLGVFALGSWKLARAWTMLSEAEVNYRTVADFTYDWETWISPDGHYRYCSPSCARLTGHSADEFINNPGILFDITHPDDQALLRQHLQQHNTTSELCEFQFRIKLPNGQLRWMEHSCVPVYGTTGDFLGRRAVNRDISERHRAEAEKSRLHNYLKELFDAMPSVVVGVDKDCLVTHWNRQAALTSDIKPKQAVTQPVFGLLPVLTSHKEQIINAVATGSELKMERIVSQNLPEYTYTDVLVYPLISPGMEGAVIRLDNVTERTRMEERLVQTEKMLSVGGLAGGMAHELNSPLGGMVQGIQNIRRRFSTERDKNIETALQAGFNMQQLHYYLQERQIDKLLDSLSDAGSRASAVVNNMLRFSHMPENTFISTNLEDLLEQCIELAAVDYDLKQHFDFHTIIIKRDYQSQLPPVDCIPGEIQQVILNLLRNAAQALSLQQTDSKAKSKVPCITLRTRQNGNQLQFEIEDNGPGMTQETCRRAFEPFFSTRPAGKGAGLGLSICYYIIHDEHHGSIKMGSQHARGTKFTITLPRQQSVKSAAYPEQ